MLVVLAALVGCTPTPTAPVPTALPTGDPIIEEPDQVGFVSGELCLVRTVFEISCVTGCHSAVVAGGGLDLQTDPHSALVGQPSQNGAAPRVTAGDSLNSFLFLKMANLVGADEGGVMPPGGQLDNIAVEVVKNWIDNGAVDDCNIPPPGGDPPPPPPPPTPPVDPDPDPAPHHPVGWSAPDQHGVAANLQTDGDCRSCHGDQLDGGTAAVSCDTCHDAGWRTDCTMCHGGTANASGAPPKDVDGLEAPNLISFTAHTAHIEQGYTCVQCHYTPTDYLSNGHVFGDVTPGYGEVDYTGGIAAISTYSNGTCSNSYCHGNGRVDNGVVTDGDGPLGCTSCHPNAGSDPADWALMSGRHATHLNEGTISCYNCHANTVDANNGIVGGNYHVNGTKDLLSNDITIGQTCTGGCHGYNHNNSGW